MTETVELKPCPFCGSPAHYGEGDHGTFFVECDDECGARFQDTKELAIEAWNRRAPTIEGEARVEVKPLDDDEIMAVIRECFPWQTQGEILSLLTYEKSVPLFPQATYNVPSYRAEKFVRAIEARIASRTQEHKDD
jgi:Lar family restriction alleviation protein